MSREIPIYRCSDRIGVTTIHLDPAKVAGIVETNSPDEVAPFGSASEITRRIGSHVAEFLAAERRSGVIPSEFLPIQSGVGNIADAALSALGDHEDIPPSRCTPK